MKLTWSYDVDEVQWEELSHLYEIAPLGTKTIAYLKTAMQNSMYKCFVYCGTQLVGAGRALADGVDCSYLCDIAVHPEFQGEGIGKSIVRKLMELSEDHNKIILYANPGKEAFYEKLGFKSMATAMAIFKNQASALASGVLKDE
jgi:ribosomal protein S18 acetylase RimI-like enzyme